MYWDLAEVDHLTRWKSHVLPTINGYFSQVTVDFPDLTSNELRKLLCIKLCIENTTSYQFFHQEFMELFVLQYMCDQTLSQMLFCQHRIVESLEHLVWI